ncbi:MAG: twin-arginine translocase subunit TatB [Nitrosospira sp.]|nr:twin-arginine translocase subunit TatB [Nitrosospira sp.]
MFDISFTEILVIAIVALVVLGPERLPKVARTLGHLLGRAQRYVNDVKNDIQQEMELEELKKLKTSVHDAARSIENSVRTEINQFEDLKAEMTPVAPTTPVSTQKIVAGTDSPPHFPATSIKPAQPLVPSKQSTDDATGSEAHH